MRRVLGSAGSVWNSAFPGQQPGSNHRDRLFLESGTDINADVSRIQADILGIPAPHLLRQDFARLRGHQVVVLTIDIQQRHGELVEIHPALSQRQLPLHQEVILVQVLDHLPKSFTRNVRTVEDPFLHPDKVFHEIFVVHIFQKPQIFIQKEPGRIEEEEGRSHQVAGQVAEGIHQTVDVNLLHPDIQEGLGGIEVRGRDGGDQVSDLFRVESRIDDRKGPPEAHPHEIYLGHPMPAVDKFHDVIHIAVDMVIQGKKLISAGWGAPFNEIDLQAFLEEIVDDTPVRLEIQQGFPVKQSVDQEQRRFETGRFRPVIFEPDPVGLKDQFVRRGPDIRG